MSGADKRIGELLDRWLASLDLHASYLDLDEQAYAKAQPWPPHQRPTRWILELARSRVMDLKGQIEDRRTTGDLAFFASLELMSFLTTLLGSEHIQRSIPLARPPAAPVEPTVTVEVPRPTPVEPPDPSPASLPAAEPPPMPSRPVRAPARPARAPRSSATKSEKQGPPPPDKVASTVIADAVRLLEWGREWPQLAGLISRLANRPPEDEVWDILRTYRPEIESRRKPAR
jgi:hypothetical protein